MFIKLISIFIIVPLVELAILIKASSYIGLWNTILIVILTGILGAALTKHQGFMVLNKIRATASRGRVPQELIDGFLVLAGGIVLLTPGFLTDICGFLLLIPWTRSLSKKFVSIQLGKYADYKTSITVE